jgi:sugar phosphate isomerase/epimerase
MILGGQRHLAYCTNIHPGGDWAQTFDSLNRWTLRVKEKLEHTGPYAIGLRLGDQAARELSDPARFLEFQRWLDQHGCYVFTINGFPFGQFHGTRVKEEVYRPDWTDPRRLDYTLRLFELLSRLVPAEVEGSVSTLPGSFKAFIHSPDQAALIRRNLWRCVEQVAEISQRTNRRLHLGLEPEPLCWIENSFETVRLFDQLRAEHPGDVRLDRHLGVNYDTCHFAVEHESAAEALERLRQHGVRLSKVHLSNALKCRPEPGVLARLGEFTEDVYLHQVILRHPNGGITKYLDLPDALASPSAKAPDPQTEWRVHFHVPLHSSLEGGFGTTADHVSGLLAWLKEHPGACSHFEMETYTWAVLPSALKTRDVTDQLVEEYRWTLRQFAEHGLAGPS